MQFAERIFTSADGVSVLILFIFFSTAVKMRNNLKLNSVEQPSGSNRTMNAKYKRLESAAAIGSARCASVCLSSCSFNFIHEIIRSFIRFSQLLNRKVDYEKMIEVYAKQKSPAIYFESSRIATNQLRSLIINASMHALNVQLKALRIGGIQLRKEAY
ncbi:hypothetical protein T08_15630 [Trichinella sp. T8]|nr:hypothetical protein T08_15630 [Trichinella sp. T8]